MQLSIELTMYPFNPDYIPPIKGCIARLNTFTGLTVQTFPSATILSGDYDLVMDSLKDVVRWSQENYGKVVFVAKILPDSNLLAPK